MTGVEIGEFIAARLDEDEAAAKACADNDGRLAWWDSRVAASGDHTIRTQGSRVVARIRRCDVEGDFGRLLDPDALAIHIARHDPARVLREVEVWRRILLEHRLKGVDAVYAGTERETGFHLALSFALKAKAALYDDHPDYPPDGLWPSSARPGTPSGSPSPPPPPPS